jgi:hypothetical protein
LELVIMDKIKIAKELLKIAKEISLENEELNN